MKRNSLLIIVTLITLYSCTQNGIKKNNIFSIEKNVIETTIESEQNEQLLVRTTVYDSCKINSSTFHKGVTSQELLFLKEEEVVVKEELPVSYTQVSSNCSDSLQVIETVIYAVGLIKGSKGNVFVIKGSGLCNACPELFGFYSVDGKLLWFNHASKSKVIKNDGDFKIACETYGIDSLEWMNNTYKSVSIDL